MEFALAAGSALASAVGGGASAIGSALGIGAPMNLAAAAGGGGSLLSGSTALSILQGGVGLLGAMSAVRAGQSQAAAYGLSAADARAQATNETIAATEKETSLRKALVASLGERDVAYAASGVDLTFGTPAAARAGAIDDATRAMSTARLGFDARRSQALARAAGYDALAADAEEAGNTKAFGSLAGVGIDILKRG